MSSLKPCPFCNSTAHVPIGYYSDGSRITHVECMVCGARAYRNNWNTRASDATAEKLAGLLRWLSEQMVFREEYQKKIDAALAAYDAERKDNHSDQRSGGSQRAIETEAIKE